MTNETICFKFGELRAFEFVLRKYKVYAVRRILSHGKIIFLYQEKVTIPTYIHTKVHQRNGNNF